MIFFKRREFFLSLFQAAQSFFHSILTVFMPQYCYGCDHKLKSGHIICTHCLDQLIVNQCVEVQRPREIQEKILKIVSIWDYTENISLLIEKIKFKKHKNLLKLLLDQIKVDDLKELGKYDFLTYVPLSFSGYVERGFNQSKIIAKDISKKLNIPLMSLFKRKKSEKQSSKNKEERMKMLSSSPFILKKLKIPFNDQKILIIDDIITTGATLASVSTLLAQKGAKTASFTIIHAEKY